jgi:hypothetical protein
VLVVRYNAVWHTTCRSCGPSLDEVALLTLIVRSAIICNSYIYCNSPITETSLLQWPWAVAFERGYFCGVFVYT